MVAEAERVDDEEVTVNTARLGGRMRVVYGNNSVYNVSKTLLNITFFFFFSSRRRHTRLQGDWSSDVCSSDLDDIALGDALQRRFVLVINGHAVQEIEHDLGEVVADLVIGQDVQLRHDLVDVLLDAPPHGGVGKRVFLRVAEDRCFDDRISREGRFGGAALLQMVARQARAELVDGAEGPPSEPPGHATPPPSFLSWAYPIPRR